MCSTLFLSVLLDRRWPQLCFQIHSSWNCDSSRSETHMHENNFPINCGCTNTLLGNGVPKKHPSGNMSEYFRQGVFVSKKIFYEFRWRCCCCFLPTIAFQLCRHSWIICTKEEVKYLLLWCIFVSSVIFF